MLKVIKNQKYQTEKEVTNAATMGKLTAIQSSIRHWRELATAPVGDLVSGGDPGLCVHECALCGRYGDVSDCTLCPLFQAIGDKCYYEGELYQVAATELRIIKRATSKRQKDAAVKRFRRAAEKLMKVLESCLEGENETTQ